MVIGTDCIGSCKSNYHTITTMTVQPPFSWWGIKLIRKVWRYQRGVIRSRRMKKNRQYNGQKKKDKQWSTKHFTETKYWPVVFFYLHLPMVQSTLHVYYTPKKATSIIVIMIYEWQIMKQYQHPRPKNHIQTKSRWLMTISLGLNWLFISHNI